MTFVNNIVRLKKITQKRKDWQENRSRHLCSARTIECWCKIGVREIRVICFLNRVHNGITQYCYVKKICAVYISIRRVNTVPVHRERKYLFSSNVVTFGH